ncbi:FAS1 domain-containing protein [Chytridium lagenaria]|nr:FAS1 domain-containing protein [Chytridium lagenaria]
MYTTFLSILAVAGVVAAQANMAIVTVLSSATGETNVSTLIGLASRPEQVAVLGSLTTLPESGFPVENNTVVSNVLLYHGLASTFIPTTAGTYYLNTLRNSTKNFGLPSVLVARVNTTGTTTVTINGATVRVIRSETFNGGAGVVHFISNVLIPPVSVSETATAAGLTGIAGALTAANILAPLNALQGITVFVPSNAAFQAIQGVTLTPTQLQGALAFHVVPGVIYAGELTRLLTGASGNSLNNVGTYLPGQNLSIVLRSFGPTVSGPANTPPGANITSTDILIDSGVIHLIDAVLLPTVSQITTAPSLTQITPSANTAPATTSSATSLPTSTAANTTRTSGDEKSGSLMSLVMAMAVGSMVAGIMV